MELKSAFGVGYTLTLSRRTASSAVLLDDGGGEGVPPLPSGLEAERGLLALVQGHVPEATLLPASGAPPPVSACLLDVSHLQLIFLCRF